MTEAIAFVGSRQVHPNDLERIRTHVSLLPTGSVLVSGGASGVDTASAQSARDRGLEVVEIKPQYDRHAPRLAPKLRNWQIAQLADRAIAFWNGMSPGTAHVIACFTTLGKPVEVVRIGRKETT